MKAFYLNKKGEFVPYKNGEKPTESFWFIYYPDDGGILFTSSIILHVEIDDIDMHHKAVDTILVTKKWPVGAGIFSTERKTFDSWQNILMDNETPELFRQPIIDFFTNELKIL